MPGKPPYFPLYPNDFTADAVVELMTTEQVGAYFLLVCKAWSQEPTGTLPNDNTALARWSRLPLERWLEIKAGILAAFRIGENGLLHQKRMEHEYSKLMGTLSKKSRGGKKGAKSRWQCYGTPKDKANGNAMTTIRAFGSNSGSSSESESGSGPPSPEGGAGGNPTGFAAFWASYPRKVAKSKAAEVWLKINPDHALQATILAAIEKQKHSAQWLKNSGEYIPHPTTWLNQGRWTDELPEASAHPPPGRGQRPDQFGGINEFQQMMEGRQHGDTARVHGHDALPGSGGEPRRGATPDQGTDRGVL